MNLLKLFIPEGMFNNIYEISSGILCALGKKGVIFDIDNTVAPYEVERPTQDMKAYFDSLTSKGIQVAFVSNNKHDRAEIFNEELSFFVISDASKPSPKGIYRCADYMKLEKENLIVIGDQIFTDCLAAHLADVECFLVKPIKDKKTLFFRFKRFFEKPFIKLYNKRKANKK